MENNEIQVFAKQHFIKIDYSEPDTIFLNTETESPNPMIGYITVDTRGKGGGNSKKIKNVSYRLKDVCLAIVDKGLVMAGAASLNSSLAIIAACLLILNEINEINEKIKVELSEVESLIVFSLFILSTNSKSITLDSLRERVDIDAYKGKITVPSDSEMGKAIRNLEHIKAVRVSDKSIELIEEVCIRK